MTFLAFGTRATGLLRGEAAAGVAGLGRRRRRRWVEEGGEEVEEDEDRCMGRWWRRRRRQREDAHTQCLLHVSKASDAPQSNCWHPLSEAALRFIVLCCVRVSNKTLQLASFFPSH